MQILQDHLYAGERVLRERAAEFLSRMRSRAVVRKLARALSSPRDYVSTRAAWGLTLCKDDLAIDLLERALNGGNPRIRSQAAWALGQIENSRARKVLVSALESPRREVRAQAASGLWRAAVNGYRNARVEKTLMRLLKGDKGGVALTLSHMLRNRTSPPRKRPDAVAPTAFERHGGAWIR